MYIIAFMEKSLVQLIFAMGLMLNPFVTIPISISIKFLASCFQKCIPRSDWLKSLVDKVCFSMTLYFVVVCASQIYLTGMWKHISEDLEAPAFDYYKFNQCKCNLTDRYSCILSPDEEKQFNIEKSHFLKLIGPENVPYVMIFMTSIIFLWWIVVESVRSQDIPMEEFLLGKSPNDQIEGEQHEMVPIEANLTEQIEDNEGQQEQPCSTPKKKGKKWTYFRFFCLLISLLYILALALSPFTFRYVKGHSQGNCPNGTFDEHPDEDVVKCRGKYIQCKILDQFSNFLT